MSLQVQVDFEANIAKFTKSMDKMSSKMDKFASNATKKSGNITNAFDKINNFKFSKIGLAITAITATLGALISKSVAVGDALDKMSKRTSISVENLNGLSFAAKLSDVNVDSLTRGLVRLSRIRFEQQDLMKQLGVSKDQTNYQAFLTIAKGLKQIEDESQRAAIANKIFGVSYRELIPLLNEADGGIQKLSNEGKLLGNITKRQAQIAAEFADNVERYKTIFKGLAVSIATPFENAFNIVSSVLIKLYKIVVATFKVISKIIVDSLAKPLQAFTETIKQYYTRVVDFWSALIKQVGGIASAFYKSFVTTITQYYNKFIEYYNRLIESSPKVAAAIGLAKKAYIDSADTISNYTAPTFKFIDNIISSGKHALNSTVDIFKLIKKEYEGLGNDLSSEKINLSNINNSLDKTAKSTNKIGKAVKSNNDKVTSSGNLMTTMLNNAVAGYKKLQSAAKQYADLAISPFEKVQNKLKEIQQLKQAGFLTDAQAAGASNNLTQGYSDNVQSIRLSLLPQDQQQKQTAINDIRDKQNQLLEAQQLGKISLTEYTELYDQLEQKASDYADGTIERQQMITSAMQETADVAAGTLTQAFEDLFTTQKKGLAEYLKSFLSAIRKIITQLLVRLAINLAIKAVETGLGGGTTNAAAGNGNALAGGLSSSSIQANNITPAFQSSSQLFKADGGAFNKGVEFFANGGVFDKPTGFKHANGIGVLGEAGPEAILPLTRGPNGKLGVQVYSNKQQSQNSQNSPVININITSENGNNNLNQLARKIEGPVRRIIKDEQRPGGLLA